MQYLQMLLLGQVFNPSPGKYLYTLNQRTSILGPENQESQRSSCKSNGLDLVECREGCGCRRECENWLTQEQIQLRMEIDYFKDKGFGVRIKDFVSKGTYCL
jgi:hypothetical protein